MQLGVVGDWFWNGPLHAMTGWQRISDQRILDFIDAAEWISLWLLITVKLISLFGLIAIYYERKISAWMQSRLGPRRVGPVGLLQTLADGLKLLEKEDITPKAADPALFVAAPLFVFASAVAMFVVLPFFSIEGKADISVTDFREGEVVFARTVVEEDGQERTIDSAAERIEIAMSKFQGSALERRKHRRALENGEKVRELDAGEYDPAVLEAFEEQNLASFEHLLLWMHDPKNVIAATSLRFRGKDASNLIDAGPTAAEPELQGEMDQAWERAISIRAKGGVPDGAGLPPTYITEVGNFNPMHMQMGLDHRALLAPLQSVVVPKAHIDRPWYGTPAYISAGLFFILAISSVSVMGVVLAGWGSNNKWSLYGAIREAAQMVSYEIPMGIGALCVVVACGTLNLVSIAQAQETGAFWSPGADMHGGILSWNLLKYPVVMIPVFLMWYIGVLAHTKRAPFDLPEAESELIAGFLTEYTGMRWSLFFLAEYGEMYAMSALTAVLFLGGMASPIPGLDGIIKDISPVMWAFWGAFWLLAKSLFLVFLMMWLRWTLPRIRLDQVMYLCLKVLLPFTMVALLVQTLWTLYLG